MHSYEDRIRAVELYYRYGKKASVVVMELGYPSIKQLGRWVRIYEEKGDLPRELKPRERYSRTQKIAAVEHYLTHGGCLSYTRRAIGYPSNEILKRWIEEFYGFVEQSPLQGDAAKDGCTAGGGDEHYSGRQAASAAPGVADR